MRNVFFFLIMATFVLPGYSSLFWVETFQYADGELTVNDGTGDDVSSGVWTPHSGETFNDNLMVVNHELQVNASGSEDANRSAGKAMGAGETWYYGVSFRVTDQRSDPNTESINNDYFAHFMDSGFGFRGRLYLDDPNVADPTAFTVGLASTSGGQASKWASDLLFGVTYKAVVSYEYDTGATALWIDPVSAASTSITDVNAAGNNTAIEALAFRQDFISGTPNNQVVIGSAAIGDDFNSVLSAIPEPTTFGLIGIGMLLLFLRRFLR